jgi:hypothetical protein
MKYYFKVWLFTILVSPLFVVAGLVYLKSAPFSDFFKGLPIWFFAVLFGSSFALPALFLFRLLNKDLAKSEIPVHLNKLIHAIVGMVLLWITFFFMNREIFSQLSWDNIAWPLAYSITLLIGAFIFKLKEESV